MNQLDTSARVFSTGNLSLAITLSACGCQFANADGKTLAGLNKYSLGFIREQKDRTTGQPLCAGMAHEDAARHLWRVGIPGNVTYCFMRSDALSAICEGWDEQAQAEPDAQVTLEADAKECGKLARRLMQTRAEFIGDREQNITPLWRRRDKSGELFIPVIAHTVGTSTTTRDGDRTVTEIRDAALRGVKV